MGNYSIVVTTDTTRALKSVIIIDGVERGKVGHGEFVSLQVANGEHTLVLRNCGSKTKPFKFVVSDNIQLITVKMVFLTKFSIEEMSEQQIEQLMKNPNGPKKVISSVKVIGTRAGMETRVLATYNFTVYSFLVIYEDGTREVVECKNDTKEFETLIKFIE